MSTDNSNNWRRESPGLPEPENDAAVISVCPHCRRKLLSTRSVMCNWCGKRIEDPEYLERAAEERAQQDARERDEIEQELDMTAKLGVRGYIKKKAKNPDPTLLARMIPPDNFDKR